MFGKPNSAYSEHKNEYSTEKTKSKNKIRMLFMHVARFRSRISFKEFKSSLKLKSTFFAKRLFRVFDKDESGWIDLNEFVEVIDNLQRGGPNAKIKLLFDICDTDGGGTIDRKELTVVMKACSNENGMSLTDYDIKCLVASILQVCDLNKDDVLTFAELLAAVESYPGLAHGLSVSMNRLFEPENKLTEVKEAMMSLAAKFTLKNLRKMLRNSICYLIIFLLNIIVFSASPTSTKLESTKLHNAWAAECIILNSCLALLFDLQHISMYILRVKFMNILLPVRQFENRRSLCFVLVLFLAVIHVASFSRSYGIIFVFHSSLENLFTGIVLSALLLILLFCTLIIAFFKDAPQLFYFSHFLVVPYLVSLAVHAPVASPYLSIPIVLYFCETLYRLYKMFAQYTHIKSIIILPSNCLKVTIKKPKSFHHDVFDYVQLNIPSVSWKEWHSFTIASSCPEYLKHDDGTFSVYVNLGDAWSDKLLEMTDNIFIKEKNQMINCQSNFSRFESHRRGHCGIYVSKHEIESRTVIFTKTEANLKYLSNIASTTSNFVNSDKILKVCIDGPCNRPSKNMMKCEHVVLIGNSSKASYFASALQTFLQHYKSGSKNQSSVFVKKVDFIWICRSHKSIEWFLELLAEIEMKHLSQVKKLGNESERFIEINVYLKFALSKTELRSIIINMAFDLMYKRTEHDVITGLRSKYHSGNPHWNQIFTELKSKNQDKDTSIFYCGTRRLKNIIQGYCRSFGFHFNHIC